MPSKHTIAEDHQLIGATPFVCQSCCAEEAVCTVGGDGHIERSRSASAHSPAGDLNVDMFPDDPPELKEARKQYRDHECRECGELGHIRQAAAARLVAWSSMSQDFTHDPCYLLRVTQASSSLVA